MYTFYLSLRTLHTEGTVLTAPGTLHVTQYIQCSLIFVIDRLFSFSGGRILDEEAVG